MTIHNGIRTCESVNTALNITRIWLIKKSIRNLFGTWFGIGTHPFVWPYSVLLIRKQFEQCGNTKFAYFSLLLSYLANWLQPEKKHNLGQFASCSERLRIVPLWERSACYALLVHRMQLRINTPNPKMHAQNIPASICGACILLSLSMRPSVVLLADFLPPVNRHPGRNVHVMHMYPLLVWEFVTLCVDTLYIRGALVFCTTPTKW